MQDTLATETPFLLQEWGRWAFQVRYLFGLSILKFSRAIDCSAHLARRLVKEGESQVADALAG